MSDSNVPTSRATRKNKRKLSVRKLEEAKAHRAELAALSRAIKVQMEMGQFPDCARVNEALIEVYSKKTGQSDFRRFREWKEAGFSVRKGERAFRVWAKPRKIAAAKQANNGGEAAQSSGNGGQDTKDEFDWFPICCLFHAGQVEDEDGNSPPSLVPPIFRVIAQRPLALPAPRDWQQVADTRQEGAA